MRGVFRPITAVVAAAIPWMSLVASPSAQAQPVCGPDQATALQPVLAQLRPEPWTDQPWNPAPIAGNFDPCADLSTVLLTIERGTASSPVQALMFHHGE